jgi:hypothetical protein
VTPEVWATIITSLVVPILVRVVAHYLPWITQDVPGTPLDDGLGTHPLDEP